MAGSTLASATASAPVAAAAVPRKRVSPWGEAWRRFRKHRLAVASAVLLSLIILAVLLGPLFWRVPIDEIDFSVRLEGPSWEHPLGTDDLGRDVGIGRVEHDRRRTMSFETHLNEILQVVIERDLEVGPRRRWIEAELPHRSTGGVDFDPPSSRRAPQLPLISAFDTELADLVIGQAE